MKTTFLVFTLFLSACVQPVFCQSTAFTYQGKLNNGGSPANGQYDFEFTLWDAPTGGNPAPPITRTNVQVTNGVFTVVLDFGENVYPRADFIEIKVRPAGGGTFTPLTPRQELTSVPYSILSLKAGTADNAAAIGGEPLSSLVLQTDPRLADARSPLPGSSEYIQNGTSTQAGNFTISGTGKAGIFDAATQYNLNGQRILSVDNGGGTFIGVGAGHSNVAPPALGNTFVGTSAGFSNADGGLNTFLGSGAGFNNNANLSSFFGYAAGSNSNSDLNSFFGSYSGVRNSSGTGNSFFGSGFFDVNSSAVVGTGAFNTTGNYNSFFGHRAGEANTTGSVNSFIGTGAGFTNTSGGGNTFFGHDSGNTNTTGSFNSALGNNADVGSGELKFATAIGAEAVVNANDTIVIGKSAGTYDNEQRFADTVVIPGTAAIGTSAPSSSRLHVVGSSFGERALYLQANDNIFGGTVTAMRVDLNGTNAGTVASFGGHGDFRIDAPNVSGGRFYITESGKVGIGLNFDQSPDKLAVNGTVSLLLGSAGSTHVCINGGNQLSSCSSSRRYKQNINNFTSGLSLIDRLRPVSFNWKANDQADMGLVAEEVADAEPLLVTRNDKGEIEGVKYDRIGVVAINAIKEQQAQIEAQQKEIDELKTIVCSLKPDSSVCQRKEK